MVSLRGLLTRFTSIWVPAYFFQSGAAHAGRIRGRAAAAAAAAVPARSERRLRFSMDAMISSP